jgi:hypothetical protein
LDGVFLLGDNFYPQGIDDTLGSSQFSQFTNVLAYGMECMYYPVMGNHDWLGNGQAQIDFASVDSRWKMAGGYYRFEKFVIENLHACVWFIDTNNFDYVQSAWLDTSIAHSDNCDWKIVAGHYPVFTAGEYFDSDVVLKFRNAILPTLHKHKIDLYISAHEHQSQILKDETTTYLISGATSDMRGINIHGHELLLWINSSEVSFLDIVISHNFIDLKFQKSYGGRNAAPICSATISKSGDSVNILELNRDQCI